jgi:4-hydroxy-tetrahydrodipicolinate synthase
MLSASSLKGTYTALITPFDSEGGVDFQSFSSLVERQIASGIDGLVPCGTTGEASTMEPAEQAEVIAVCVEIAAGRVPVIAGVGSMSTAVSCQLARAAADAGADALLLVTPPYNKPTQAGLVAHFKKVAEAGVARPLVFYNVPGRTAFDAGVDCIAAVCAAVPEVIAVKEATGSVERAAQLHARFGDSLALLSGDDFTLLPFYSVGGQGCISVVSNILPATTAAIYKHLSGGDLAAAQRAFSAIRPLVAELFSCSNPIPVKMAAAKLGFCAPQFRLPLLAPAERELIGLYAALAACEEL